MKRLLSLMAAVLLFGSIGEANAGVIINWTGGSNFDIETITFAPTIANAIVAINGSDSTNYTGDPMMAGAFAHAHGGSTTMFIDVNLNGVWTNVYSHPVGGSPDEFFISSITTPITFSLGTVDGLRVYTDVIIGNAFHQWQGGSAPPSFTFDTVTASAVPEPATMTMLGIGVAGMFGYGLRRRRANTEATPA